MGRPTPLLTTMIALSALAAGAAFAGGLPETTGTSPPGAPGTTGSTSPTPSSSRLIRLLASSTTRDSGIMGALLIGFRQAHPEYVVETDFAGSGELLGIALKGEGDVLLVNWPAAEQRWMQTGKGAARQLVMYDRFFIVGPENDPANIRGATPEEALRRIAQSGATFVSHGDASGSNVRELQVWGLAGIDPQGQSWYLQAEESPARTLQLASEAQAYTFSDSATFTARGEGLSLSILVENDPRLLDAYHVITVSASSLSGINEAGGRTFAEYLASEDAQAIIRGFGGDRFGGALYTPAAHESSDTLLAPAIAVPDLETPTGS